MSKVSIQSIKKKSFLFLVILNLSVLLSLLAASGVLAATPVNRINGDDRYKTAVAVSQAGWPNGSNTVILATGNDFPDAICATPLASKNKAPILLTQPETLNSDTQAELARLKAKNVIIIGGVGAISTTVENQLAKLNISTKRIAGKDRYDTSVLVAQALGGVKGAFVTTGLDFPDSLSAAPIAAAQGMPILLVPNDNLPSTTKAYLSSSKVSQLYVLNGGNEISDHLISQLPNPDVITGSDGYERNINLIQRFADTLSFDSIYAATGTNYPDALAASALAQANNSPLILLPSDSVPAAAAALLRSKVVSNINIIGGESAVSPNLAAVLASLPAQIISVSSVTDSVTDKQKYTFPKTVLATISDGSQVPVPVTWSLVSVNTGLDNISTNINAETTYTYQGEVPGYSGTATLVLSVDPKPVTLKFYNPTMQVVQGDSYDFPTTVAGVAPDNTLKQYPVTWNSTSTASLKNVGSYTFQGTVQGVTQKPSLTLKVIKNDTTPLTIPDGGLFSAIQKEVTGSSTGSAITLSQALKITQLTANNMNIRDLTGLDQLQNLTYLDLSHNYIDSSNISNLAVLKKLPNLNVLIINDNQISDFSKLTGLSHLYSLYVNGNPATNISALNSYKNLIYRDFTVN